MAAQTQAFSELAHRYANALLETAKGSGTVDDIDRDSSDILAILSNSADFARMIKNPSISRNEQMDCVREIGQKAKFNEQTINFMLLLVANRRLYALGDILNLFKELVATYHGKTTVQVTCAKNLTEKQKTKLIDELSNTVEGDIVLKETVDADILGGLIVTVGSKMVDSSINSKLERMKLILKGAI